MWFGAPCQPWAAKGMYGCMACPSGRVHRVPGAYPTRCVGVRGSRVRALKQQRVCVRRRSVVHLGGCSIELVSFSPNYALARKGTPMGRIGNDK
jgi:hypothetical protein